jgi:hypothetical protein
MLPVLMKYFFNHYFIAYKKKSLKRWNVWKKYTKNDLPETNVYVSL